LSSLFEKACKGHVYRVKEEIAITCIEALPDVLGLISTKRATEIENEIDEFIKKDAAF
jgi:hypothetical protein